MKTTKELRALHRRVRRATFKRAQHMDALDDIDELLAVARRLRNHICDLGNDGARTDHALLADTAFLDAEDA